MASIGVSTNSSCSQEWRKSLQVNLTLHCILLSFFQIIHSGKLCHELMKSYNGNDKVICLTFFLLCPLSFFKPMSIRELRRSPAVSSRSTWSLVVNIYLMGRHVSCMLDQSVTLIRSFSSPVWTFSTFSSFIKTYYLVLLMLALVCACMTISIAGQKGHSKAKSGKVFSAR